MPCAEWDPQRPWECDAVRLVLVNPESAVGDALRLWLRQKEGAQQLDRIYIDECHVILNNRTDFRCKLQQVGKFSHAEAPMVLLTATLPPSCESKLWRRIGWNALQVRIIRARTSRANIGYRTIWVPGECDSTSSRGD